MGLDKRSITLSPELAAAVDDVVATGEYASASEVVRNGLRQWKEWHDLFYRVGPEAVEILRVLHGRRRTRSDDIES